MNRLITFYKLFFTENIQWFVAMALWFCVAGLVGFLVFFDNRELVESLSKIISDISGDAVGADLFWIIFKNNLTVSLIAVASGLLFGLLPLLMAGFNGFLIGYLLSALFQMPDIGFVEAGSFTVASLVPHGIIELPIIVLSAAVGVRLGTHWIFQSIKYRTGWQAFKKDFLFALASVPVIIVGLFVAAILEVFVTGFIVDRILL